MSPLPMLTESHKIDLGTLKNLCKAKETELDEMKKQSVASKKALAEQTRAFMKLSPEDSVAAFRDLLRVYQLEVENLSKRCRLGETAFMSLSSGLDQVPATPVAPLSVSNSSEISSLKAEIRDLEKELMTMKNQDVAVRLLEARIKEMENQRKAELGVAETEMAKRLEEAANQARFRIESLQSETERFRGKVSALEVELAEGNQLRLLERQKADQTVKMKQDEINSLNDEIESLKVRISTASGASGTVNMYKELVEREEERITALDREVENLKTQLSSEQQNVKQANSELQVKTEELGRIRDEKVQESGKIRTSVETALGPVGDLPIADFLQKAIGDFTSDARAFKKKVDELQAVNVRLESELKAKAAEINELKNSQSSSPEQITTVANASSDEVVSIIQAQRDRFRSRVLELESERDQLKQSQFELNNRINVMLSDQRKMENEKNFWKSQSAEQKVKSPPSDIELGAMSSNGPPSLTSIKRRVAASNDMEQTLTSILVWGLGNPVTRRAAFGYLITLHLLVFFVLYRLSAILSSQK